MTWTRLPSEKKKTSQHFAIEKKKERRINDQLVEQLKLVEIKKKKEREK